MSTVGWVKADGSYEVTMYFSGIDSFKDPYDLLNLVPDWMFTFECPFSSTYWIFANWEIKLYNTVETVEDDE